MAHKLLRIVIVIDESYDAKEKQRDGARSNDKIFLEKENVFSPPTFGDIAVSVHGKKRSRTESTESESRRRRWHGNGRDLYSRAIRNDISVVARILGILGCRPRFFAGSRPFRTGAVNFGSIIEHSEYRRCCRQQLPSTFIWNYYESRDRLPTSSKSFTKRGQTRIAIIIAIEKARRGRLAGPRKGARD